MTFSSEFIAALRTPLAAQVSIQIVEETQSTNADLLASLPHLTGPTLLIANTQTAGRGRAGRTWYSVPGQSLTFSLAWKFNRPMQALLGLPLAVGVVVAEALGSMGMAARLKWPNDLLHDEKKLGGILIETASDSASACAARWAVIGIGLNLVGGDLLAQQVGQSVACLKLPPSERAMLMAKLLNALAAGLTQFAQHGFAAFQTRWNGLHAYEGRPVAIIDYGQVLHQGSAIGVDSSGRFLIETPSGQVAITAGDVSLRAQEG